MKNILNEIKSKENVNSHEEILLNEIAKQFFDKNPLRLNYDSFQEEYFNFLNIFNGDKPIDIGYAGGLSELNSASDLLIDFYKNNKKIIFLSDSDFDGTSALAILHAIKIFLQKRYPERDYFYESYFCKGENHGITFTQVDSLIDDIDEEVLIITADNGINNELSDIKSKFKNVKIIITDHHLPTSDTEAIKLADFIINPEVTKKNFLEDQDIIKEKVTSFKINNCTYQTSFSGAYTLFFLMQNFLIREKLAFKDIINEIKTIALLSNIGDIINFGVDSILNLNKNQKLLSSTYLMKGFKGNLSNFEIFPKDKENLKESSNISKAISIVNASKRLNQAFLFLQENLDDEKAIIDKFKERYLLDLEKEKINNIPFITYFKMINEEARAIYEHFFPNDTNNLNISNYTYLKSIIPFLFLQKNIYKNEEDNAILNKIYDILLKINDFKATLKNNLIEKECFVHIEEKNIEVFYTDLSSAAREILSIIAFTKKSDGNAYFILTSDSNSFYGSLRDQMKNNSIKDFLLENKSFSNYKKEKNLNIEIYGHQKAAGLFLNFEKFKEDKTKILKRFISELNTEMENEKILKEGSESLLELTADNLKNINILNMFDILKKYFFFSPHPFFNQIDFKIKGSEILKLNNNNELIIKNSKKGSLYSIIDNDELNPLTLLYFPNENEKFEEDKYYKTNLDIKYHFYKKKYRTELIINLIKEL